MTSQEGTRELRSQIFEISLTPINDIYYVPPGTDGSVGLSDKKIDQLLALISDYTNRQVALTEKAFGGCKKCYGKGYSTVMEGEHGYEDFGGDGFDVPPHVQMRFCSCDRGKQLATLREEE